MHTRLLKRLGGTAAVVVILALGQVGCRSATDSEVEVEVRNVGIDQGSQSPVVVLQDKERRLALPIWIGAAEAQAIAMQMEGISPPRPMTHDLVKTMLEEAGVDFDRVVIGALEGSTYFASIHLHSGRRGLEVDSRPSDAIALAVRFKKPIFVRQSLLRGDTTIDLQRVTGPSTVSLRGVTVQPVSAELAEYFDLAPGRGVLVAGVEQGITAVRPGDVIVRLNGADLAGLTDFQEKLTALGEAPAHLAIQRGAERLEVSLAAQSG